jgi:hypothetical protein
MMMDEEQEEVFLCKSEGYHSGWEELHQMAIFENGKITKNITRWTYYGGDRYAFGGEEYEDDYNWIYDDNENSTFFQDAFEDHVRQAKQVPESAFNEILKERGVE